MRFLVDTDVCSAFVKKNPGVSRRFSQYYGGICLSKVTLGELFTWTSRSAASPRLRSAVNSLLSLVEVLPIDDEVAIKFGEVRAGLFDIGRPLPVPDLLNASVALVHDLTMVTHNTKDYAAVPGLRLADWLDS